jgi:uracil-DNA glycosylase
LGNVASSYILNLDSITNKRGKVIHKDGLKFFITYHPAATLYNRSLLYTFELDIKKLAEYVS